MGTFRLGWREFLFLAGTLTCLTLLVWILFAPDLRHEWCVHYYIPSVHVRFGFRADRITVPGTTDERLAIVELATGGPLFRAGFRVGDVPVDHHGGETAFCGALQSAEAGGRTYVSVVNASDWHQGWTARRDVAIPSLER